MQNLFVCSSTNALCFRVQRRLGSVVALRPPAAKGGSDRMSREQGCRPDHAHSHVERGPDRHDLTLPKERRFGRLGLPPHRVRGQRSRHHHGRGAGEPGLVVVPREASPRAVGNGDLVGQGALTVPTHGLRRAASLSIARRRRDDLRRKRHRPDGRASTIRLRPARRWLTGWSLSPRSRDDRHDPLR